MTSSPCRKAISGVGYLFAATLAAFVGVLLFGTITRSEDPKPDPALERTRVQIKMLDELYKNAVVSITARYEGPPAIKVAKDVFAAMEKSGWHKAKLVDASGTPQNDANLPQTDFEKRAADAMRAGKAYYEEVTGADAERTLFAATVVPAVAKKCATCHGAKEGDLLGFIRYEVPIK
jgi:hypothetical protein